MKKKLICLGVILWYVVFVSFLTPQLLSYFFEKDTLNAELFAELISFGLPVSIALISHNKAGEPLFPFVNIRLNQERKRIITAAAVGLFYAVCMLFLNSAYELIYVFVTGSSDVVQRHTEVPPWAILYMVLIYALLPSIFEELFYRSMFDQLFSQKAKVSPIIISAFLFALMHSNVKSMVNAFILGIFLMIVYRRSHSTKTVVTIHFVYNTVSVVCSNVIVLPFSSLGVLQDFPGLSQRMYAVLAALGIGLIGFVLFLIHFVTLLGEKTVLWGK